MIQSMTGYAQKTIDIELTNGTRLSCIITLKSFNGRFFELIAKMPSLLSAYETDLGRRLKKMLLRGNVYCTAYFEASVAHKAQVVPAIEVVQGYLTAAQAISQKCNIVNDVSLNTIITLPNVFVQEDVAISSDGIDSLWRQVDDLILALVVNRQQEGAMLHADILQRIEVLEREITIINDLSALAMEQQKAKIQQLLHEVGHEEASALEGRKAVLYSTLDKIDIHEEIVRFKSHVQQLYRHLQENEIEKGKKIDFLVQEMNREINTATAKCADAAIISRAIVIKVELEKIKEQAQNIV